mgnify:CR=1 FL=1
MLICGSRGSVLGHRIDAQGLHPMEDKVEAIRDAKVPQNVAEFKAFLEILMYSQRFIPNLFNSVCAFRDYFLQSEHFFSRLHYLIGGRWC